MEFQKFKLSEKSPLADAAEYLLYKAADDEWLILNDRTGEIVRVGSAKVRAWLDRHLFG